MKSRYRQALMSFAFAGPMLAAGVHPQPAAAQETSADQPQTMETVEVTGSRIKKAEVEGQAPVFVIDRKMIERTGLQSVGDVLQQMTTSGKALNTKFNSSGNFGYPPDGGGIGAGSAQVDLRNLGSKRVLVLVDGIRWVNESSASGVSGSADLNTIPLSIVDRIEVLEDGASAIYGSDAIAGVVNIITRKTFEGAEVDGYYGEYGRGGDTRKFSLTIGGKGERWSAILDASYFDQKGISSGKWWQSAVPEPYAGSAAGSSAIPQGRFTFCDPSRPATAYGGCTPGQENFYDVVLNSGTGTPAWNPADPSSGTYHDFTGADRYNFAPSNLLLTPSKRKAIFATVSYNVTDTTQLHVKALYNNRESANQAAPEPIFVGPYAGTGGIADTISISALNPYNPFGIDLDPATNFGWITKRPVEVGPRIFDQDVDTWYFNAGLNGELAIGRGLSWDANYVHSENKAEQTFYNGYNLAHLALGLGDPAICAATPGCVPIDLFGGQGRPMTEEMIDWIRATQTDRSKQTLDLGSVNVTGDLFDLGSRAVGFSAGAEHRRYQGSFTPDPLRQNGESQDSLASAVSAAYDVDEVYGELNVPVLSTFDLNAAGRYSNYSTFGSEKTGKVGFRWEPITDLLFRGAYSTGFRAPNLGELYGLTQFGATLVDPCGPTGGAGPAAPYAAGCAAQGVPAGFEQANTQITTFTGGNPDLKPEESKSYTLGTVYSPSWMEGVFRTQRFDVELTYYHYKVSDAIGARDIQALLDACLLSGGTDPALCAAFTRQPGGNLNPPRNLLTNLSQIKTDGVDVKLNWASEEFGWGRLRGALQSTYVHEYEETDSFGNVAQRRVGVETDNGSIPKWQSNAQLGWTSGDWDVNWNLRYTAGVKEACANAVISEGLPGCAESSDTHRLGAVTYHDVQVAWSDAIGVKGLRLTAGVNNVFSKHPPVCYTCTLNGYDAGTYDLPDRFWFAEANYRF
ncbi:MAG TPA: TonB-dependent receptor [Dokdonella sp.]